MNDTPLFFLLNNSNTSTILVEKLFPKITLGIFLSTLAIFTVAGNILVLYAIQTEKNLRTVSNLFILSLAFADLAVGLFVMPLSAATIITGRWPFSSLICKMWLSIDYVASTASIFNLVLLSLDRYWAVVHPLRYLQKRTRRRATLFILIVWFISSLWAPAVIFWSQLFPHHSDIIEEHECDTSFRSNKTFKTLTALVNFYFPLLTMIIISCRIMIAIRSRSKMELGRRLSSATQKKMRRDRSFIRSSPQADLANDHHPLCSFNTIILNPSETLPIQSTLSDPCSSTKERGQCFCSSCQPDEGIHDDSIWELQNSSIKKSRASLSAHLSFVQLKSISMIFSTSTINMNSKTKNKLDDPILNPNDSSTKDESAIVLNNNHQCKIVSNSKSQTSPVVNTIKNKNTSIKLPSKNRPLSVTSSFSDDGSETIYNHPNDEENQSLMLMPLTVQNSTPSTYSQSPTYCPLSKISSNQPATRLEIPKEQNGKETITRLDETRLKQIPSNENDPRMTFTAFLDNLINPSRSHSLQKELKAARQLGMLVGVFAVSWLPYFILFLVVAWCNHCVSNSIFTASIWLGYLNSTLNPLIYPLCNVHFRQAFQKICRYKHAKTKLPNLIALRELHALHNMSRRRC